MIDSTDFEQLDGMDSLIRFDQIQKQGAISGFQ